MPLTPAHAAAVVPLSRWKPYLWLSPLVVGSMAPDYLYYLFPPKEWRHFGHSPLGLVLFCVPAGLVVLYAFHRFFKQPLVLLMPYRLRGKLWRHCGPFPLLPLPRLAWICALIFLGAVTHILWDSLTHEHAGGYLEVSQLDAVVLTLGDHQYRCYGLLQYASSALGLVLLAWWTGQWYRSAPAGHAPNDPAILRSTRPLFAAMIVLFGAAVGTGLGLRHAWNPPNVFNLKDFLTVAFITGVDALLLAVLVFGVALKLPWKRGSQYERPRRRPGPNTLLQDLTFQPEATSPAGNGHEQGR